jgi:large subunit ribosomal protein L31
MKEKIHPAYGESTVTCACGNTFKTRSTKPEIRLEICAACHPFITGKQKLLDTAGRVERFQKRFAKTEGKTVVVKAAPKKKGNAEKTKGYQNIGKRTCQCKKESSAKERRKEK